MFATFAIWVVWFAILGLAKKDWNTYWKPALHLVLVDEFIFNTETQASCDVTYGFNKITNSHVQGSRIYAICVLQT